MTPTTPPVEAVDPGSDNERAPIRSDTRRERTRVLFALALITPAGFLTKFALPVWLGGAAGLWCDRYGAAVLYEVFWVLVLRAGWPRRAIWPAAAGVLAATALIEFSQRWHTPALDAVRHTAAGAALLGNGFDWWDFPYYVLGCLAGGWLAAQLRRPPCRANAATALRRGTRGRC